MQVDYQVNENLRLSFEAQGMKGLIERLGSIAEIFQGQKCGQCDSTNVFPQHQQAQGYDFYRLRCSECEAQLDLGQRKEGGGLFIRRTDKEGNAVGKNGWYHWQRDDGNSKPAKSKSQSQPEWVDDNEETPF